jgi:selenocysteine-specific elongation factor
VAVGADEVIGKLFLNDHDSGLAQLRLERASAMVAGQPVVLREYSPPALLGGGRIVTPRAEPRRKNARVTTFAAVTLTDQLVESIGASPSGLRTDEAARKVGRSAQSLAAEFEALKARGTLLSFAGLWFTPASFEQAADRFLSALSKLHKAHPSRSMLPREPVVKEAGLPWTEKALDRIVAHLVASGKVRASGSNVALAEFKTTLEPKQRAFLDRVKVQLDAGGFSPPTPRDLAVALSVPVQAVEGVLRLGMDAGEVVRLEDQIFFTKEQLRAALDAAQSRLGGQAFTAAEFKEALGTSRKYAIPILEHADSKGWTARRRDVRVFT